MMDVLYIVKSGKGHQDRELRWSLRSLARFGRNLRRVIVAGEPPDWLSDRVETLAVPNRAGKYKNIMDACLAACEAGLVHGEFLYSSDDHFLLREADLDAVGFYKKSDCIKPASYWMSRRRPLTEHRQAMASTRELLLSCGYPAVECNFHFNTRLDADDWKEARCLYLNNRGPFNEAGVELTCMFQNVRARREGWTADRFLPGEDNKVRTFDDARKAKTERLGYCSCGDQAFGDKRWTDYMEALFPEPSKYERS